MNAREFCYWLQGHFELEPAPSNIGDMPASTVLIIRDHLELVDKVDPDHDNAFVAWLSERLSPGSTCAISFSEEKKMKKLLAAQFQHVIDPSYGGDKAELQKVHDGGGVHPPSYGPGYRC